MVSQEQLLSTAKPDVVSGEDFILSALSTDLQSWALFLDIDGTLLDLAETPDAITVPPSLPADLDALSKKLDGALALVTGRSLDYADQLFSLSHFPIAGLHGAERRDPDGQLHKATATAEFERLKADLVADTASWAGVLIEDKGAAVAAHYRLAPDRKDDVELVMERALIRAGPNWTIQQGKMVIEIRPTSADKGKAISAFLAKPPFAGRRPIAIGDDVTDEAMFRAANRLGGYSIRIGPHLPASEALGSTRSAEALRGIIAALAS
ncbi:trehalose-phosphatase (plasmid) [Sinorhizobium medicae]|uniref:trehalose-phosphatase n=1 Tax=Sinorhizobium medicae TaxID=110321 RepID=UPI0012960C2B|nr:trehalose-phosphatase [Sinorhizobium medicae]MDX0802268.1 trehalose-phosphatase [Sinorhizobium medicae]MQV97863.1 trehalose-phosphatase [Sinorhizobium medicae]WQO47548.1 trehalose-phosphatase [Sinorhizobium medicae]WQO68568.1 trehalose-phosphatase [Sinorhizobium medicae]WQO94161.1 trehalose-phosphatase [Sinorhizobium medicae]